MKINFASEISEEKNMTLPVLQKEMEEEAKEFAEFTGKKTKVPDARQIARKLEKGSIRVAFTGTPTIVPPLTKALLVKYLKEEKNLTNMFKAQIKAIKTTFKLRLKEIQNKIKEVQRFGGSFEVLQILNQRLEVVKDTYKTSLKNIAFQSSREFDQLKEHYARRDSFFLGALEQHLKRRKLFRVAGKVIIFSLIGTTMMILSSITIGSLVGLVGGGISALFGGGDAEGSEVEGSGTPHSTPKGQYSPAQSPTVPEEVADLQTPDKMSPEFKSLWDLYKDPDTSSKLKDAIENNLKESGWATTKFGLVSTQPGTATPLVSDAKSLIDDAFDSKQISAKEAEDAYEVMNQSLPIKEQIHFNALIDPQEMPSEIELLWKAYNNPEVPREIRQDIFKAWVSHGYKPSLAGLVPLRSEASLEGFGEGIGNKGDSLVENFFNRAWVDDKITEEELQKAYDSLGLINKYRYD